MRVVIAVDWGSQSTSVAVAEAECQNMAWWDRLNVPVEVLFPRKLSKEFSWAFQ